jgi:hypothetical protein
MGDRVSISFRNGDMESVSLFSHWDGISFVERARNYIEKLKKRNPSKERCMPLQRMEPRTLMVDFIRDLTRDLKLVDSNYYLGTDHMDGDNSDNGHHVIDVTGDVPQ